MNLLPEGIKRAIAHLDTLCKREAGNTKARRLAVAITQDVHEWTVHTRAERIAKWVRRFVQYSSPNIGDEVLGGLNGVLLTGVGDADDIALAIGTLCAADGIEVRFVPEQVGEHAHHWTVHVEVKLELGKWYRP